MNTIGLLKMTILFAGISTIALLNYYCKKIKPGNANEEDHSGFNERSGNYLPKQEGSDYVFLIGVDSLDGPVIAMAATGERISLRGSGSLNTHAKSASGGGDYVYYEKNGAIADSGYWNVDDLISFVSYGNSAPYFPAEIEGGKAFFRINLIPRSGKESFDAIMKIFCSLGKAPNKSDEGAKLVAPGVKNFNKQLSGETVFVRQ